MPQQAGANSVLIFDTEATFKTTPGTPDATLLPFVSESLQLKRVLESSKTLRSNRNPNKARRGNTEIGGTIAFELSPQYGKLFKHIFGSYGVSGASAPYTHTYKIAALLAGMTIEKQFTDITTDKFFLYNGCKVNSFKMTGKASGFIDCSVDIMGAKETIGTSSFDATATDIGHDPFDGMEIEITQGGGAALAVGTEISLTLENGLDGSNYCIGGGGERRSLPDGLAKVSGTLKCVFEDDVLLALAVANTETTLKIDFTHGTGTGATAGNEKMSFLMDEMVFTPASPVVSGPGGLLVELGFEAYYNVDADASALRVVLLSPEDTF